MMRKIENLPPCCLRHQLLLRQPVRRGVYVPAQLSKELTSEANTSRSVETSSGRANNTISEERENDWGIFMVMT